MKPRAKRTILIAGLSIAAIAIGVLQLAELSNISLLPGAGDRSELAQVTQQRLSLLTAAQIVIALTAVGNAIAARLSAEKLAQRLQDRMNKQQDSSSDLSDLKRLQRLLVDKAVDVICVVDIEGNFVSISHSSEQAWGYAPSELKGKPIMEVIESNEAQSILDMIGHAANSIDRIVFESRLRRKDGSVIDAVWTGHWSAGEKGLFCIVHDMSHQKQIEKGIRESEQRMRQTLEAEHNLQRMKQQFTAMVTHDLRSPLTSVRGLLLRLERGSLGEINDQGKSLSRRITSDCDRLLRLLNDMLAVETMQAGSFELECASVDLRQTIEAAVDNVRDMAAGKHVDVHVDAPTMLCMADEQRVVQVLINLLSNAIKFSNENSAIHIKVSDAGDMAMVAVEDQGRGIPEDRVSTIFEKFVQVDKRDAVEKQGSGLGLAIAKEIVERHGGCIGVESKVGQGSCFWFTVPKV